jgi:hypothetical protein
VWPPTSGCKILLSHSMHILWRLVSTFLSIYGWIDVSIENEFCEQVSDGYVPSYNRRAMAFEVKVSKMLSQMESNSHQNKFAFSCCFYCSFFRTSLSAGHAMREQPLGRKTEVLCVQSDFWCGNFSSPCMLKIEFIHFLMMMI